MAEEQALDEGADKLPAGRRGLPEHTVSAVSRR
jgi:hypothetical protein